LRITVVVPASAFPGTVAAKRNVTRAVARSVYRRDKASASRMRHGTSGPLAALGRNGDDLASPMEIEMIEHEAVDTRNGMVTATKPESRPAMTKAKPPISDEPPIANREDLPGTPRPAPGRDDTLDEDLERERLQPGLNGEGSGGAGADPSGHHEDSNSNT
jgi:hypothetical protein